jgi:hypothetical protein
MLRAFSWSLIPALVVPAIAGCGGGSSSAISLDDARQRVLAAVCQLYVNCGEAPDQASCMASLGESAGYGATLNADVASGKVIWNGTLARGCVEALERYYGAGCTQSALAAQGTPTAGCEDILVGTVAPGGPCYFTDECAGRADCELTDPACSRSLQCCLGTCVALPPQVPIGADCSAGQDCVTGFVCAQATAGGALTCREPATIEGAPCIDFFGCGLALYCDVDPATSSAPGTCKRAAATGSPCKPSVSDSCDDLRDFCDQATSVCTRRSGIGGTCDPTLRNCLGAGECVGTTCVARPKPGQACSATAGPSCLGGLTCDPQASTCTPDPVVGACG